MRDKIRERISVLEKICEIEENIEKICEILINSLKKGGKVILCGNGGSASDSSHISAEFIGKLTSKSAKPLPAINISSDPAVITAIANDYGYEHVFSKQIEAIGKKEDVLVVFSTSGKSKNVKNAIDMAGKIGLKIIYFTGKEKPLKGEFCDIVINIPSNNKQIIQEVYMILWHIIAERVEREME